MQPIFIVAGKLAVTDIGLYGDSESLKDFMHLVQATTEDEAESKVRAHYAKKTEECRGYNPYGVTYTPRSLTVWEQIGEISLL